MNEYKKMTSVHNMYIINQISQMQALREKEKDTGMTTKFMDGGTEIMEL